MKTNSTHASSKPSNTSRFVVWITIVGAILCLLLGWTVSRRMSSARKSVEDRKRLARSVRTATFSSMWQIARDLESKIYKEHESYEGCFTISSDYVAAYPHADAIMVLLRPYSELDGRGHPLTVNLCRHPSGICVLWEAGPNGDSQLAASYVLGWLDDPSRIDLLKRTPTIYTNMAEDPETPEKHVMRDIQARVDEDDVLVVADVSTITLIYGFPWGCVGAWEHNTIPQSWLPASFRLQE